MKKKYFFHPSSFSLSEIEECCEGEVLGRPHKRGKGSFLKSGMVISADSV